MLHARRRPVLRDVEEVKVQDHQVLDISKPPVWATIAMGGASHNGLAVRCRFLQCVVSGYLVVIQVLSYVISRCSCGPLVRYGAWERLYPIAELAADDDVLDDGGVCALLAADAALQDPPAVVRPRSGFSVARVGVLVFPGFKSRFGAHHAVSRVHSLTGAMLYFRGIAVAKYRSWVVEVTAAAVP